MKNLLLMCVVASSLFAGVKNASARELSLVELREEVLNNDIDIKIQYEKYYQAQRNVGVAMGEFLPRLSFNLFFFNTTYGILQGVMPTPSNWFEYKASKDLAIAEKYNTETIKLNILDGITKNYIQVKKNQDILVLLNEELTVVSSYLRKMEELFALGSVDEGAYYTVLRKSSRLKQDILLIKSINNKLKESILIALNSTPNEELFLKDLPTQLPVIPANVEDALTIAVANSSENKANQYLYKAALDMTRSARWSFISFDGIGFGYPSALAIEKSKARVIKLIIERTENEIYNQVYTAYENLEIIEERIENQVTIMDLVKREVELKLELEGMNVLPIKEILDAKTRMLQEQRTLDSLLIEKKTLYVSIQRLMSSYSSFEAVNTDMIKDAEVILLVTKETRRTQKMTMSLNLPVAQLNNIYKVNYVVDGEKFIVSRDSAAGFPLYLKGRRGKEKKIKITIDLIDGTVIEKNDVLVRF